MKKQLEFIQAIRGTAALLVVYFHTGHTPQFGAFGVDLFFVLSGALMGMLMAQDTTGTDFLWRRIVRIIPLYFLATTAAYLVSCLLPAVRTSGNIPTLEHYWMSLTFIPYEARDGQIVPVLGLGWTLNYEMAFYLCCTAACTISRKKRVVVAAVIVAVAGLTCHLFVPDTAIGRFHSNPIVTEFIAGLFLWSFFERTKARIHSSFAIAAFLGLVVYMAYLETANLSILANTGEWARPLRNLLPAMMVVGLALFAEEGFRKISPTLRRPLVFLGDSSYAIYLTHTFVIGALSIILPAMAGVALNHPLAASIAIIASILGGAGVYLWVETPILNRLRQIRIVTKVS